MENDRTRVRNMNEYMNANAPANAAGTARSANKAPKMRSGAVSSSPRATQYSTRSSAARPTRSSAPRNTSRSPEQTARKTPARTSSLPGSRSSSGSSSRPAVRPSARPASRSAAKAAKKPSLYWKLILAYSALIVVVLIVGAIIFRSFLKTYQDNQPINVIENVRELYSDSNQLTGFIKDHQEQFRCLEDIDDFAAAYAAFSDGKEISFIASNNYSENTPTYNLTADGKKVAEVTLEQTGKGRFGLAEWGVSKVDIDGFPGAHTYKILVPEGSNVTVNGIGLDDSYVTREGIPEILENSLDYIPSPPEFTTYTISVLNADPQVEAVSAAGAKLDFQTSDTVYAAGKADKDFIESVDRIVLAGIREYALYFIHMSFKLDLYIVPGCDLYVNIFGNEESQGIQTDLYNYEHITNYEFRTQKASNYIRYGDDCFTVDVEYDLKIDFDEAGMSDNNQNLKATWVWVRDRDSWSISDIVFQ